MKTYLLLGAGFSRNWGGWLASEVFEYLLGVDVIFNRPGLRKLLWEHQGKGGFESALAEVQQSAACDTANQDSLSALRSLQSGIQSMFSDMNENLFKVENWEIGSMRMRTTSFFLSRFDAIFTLNQDQLLEAHYEPAQVQFDNQRNWQGFHLPGTVPIPSGKLQRNAGPRVAYHERSHFTVEPNLQPVYKLHGSSAWSSSLNDEIMVLGANKAANIADHPLLSWYFEQFEAALGEANSKLMVIGYGFRDSHINTAIERAVFESGLKFFVIDPFGAELASRLNKPGEHTVGTSNSGLNEMFELGLCGASRRTLLEILGKDGVEYKKVMRFFE